MDKKHPHTALLLTYYWPPGAGPGVHRWLRFSRYFKHADWGLHVFSPDEAAWPIRDEALVQHISSDIIQVRRPIFEPHKYLGKKNNPNIGGGITRSKKSSLLQRLIIWIRGNVFIPDARVFWIGPSIRFLRKYLKLHPEIDTLISSGPPHSLHLIARALKKEFPQLKWVADFRDPWTEIDFYHELNIGKWADSRQKKLEQAVLKEADKVITVSDACAEGLERIGGRTVEVVTNGFEFPKPLPKGQLDSHFTLAHFGSMSMARNPEVLWKALAFCINENEEFKKLLKIHLFGPVDFGVFERIEHYGLSKYVEHIDHVNHAESVRLQQNTGVLILVVNDVPGSKGILTGKLFEYLAANRPILAIGPEKSNMEDVIRSTESGFFYDYLATEALINQINLWFNAFQTHQLTIDAKGLERFDTRNIIGDLLTDLNQLFER